MDVYRKSLLRSACHGDVGNDEEFRQKVAVLFQKLSCGFFGRRHAEGDGRVERFAQLAGGAMGLDAFVDLGADLQERGDLGLKLRVRPSCGRLRPILQVHGVLAVFGLIHPKGPSFVAGEGEHGREESNQRLEDMIDRRLRGAAQRALGAVGVEPILENVVIDGRERDRAEGIAQLVDAVKFVSLVGGGAFLDERGSVMQGPAIEGV